MNSVCKISFPVLCTRTDRQTDGRMDLHTCYKSLVLDFCGCQYSQHSIRPEYASVRLCIRLASPYRRERLATVALMTNSLITFAGSRHIYIHYSSRLEYQHISHDTTKCQSFTLFPEVNFRCGSSFLFLFFKHIGLDIQKIKLETCIRKHC